LNVESTPACRAGAAVLLSKMGSSAAAARRPPIDAIPAGNDAITLIEPERLIHTILCD
jgi:hypothetical protein